MMPVGEPRAKLPIRPLASLTGEVYSYLRPRFRVRRGKIRQSSCTKAAYSGYVKFRGMVPVSRFAEVTMPAMKFSSAVAPGKTFRLDTLLLKFIVPLA